MNKETPSNRGRRGSIMILLAVGLPLFLGLVGLGIDGTVRYIVQTELSAAVDGAALGAGRMVNDNANVTNLASEFLNANFRMTSGGVGQPGFWSAYNLTTTATSACPACQITYTAGITKTVTIAAQVTMPLLFMRLLGFNSDTVGASAIATRRDARVEFVIDRSGSMTTIDPTTGATVISELINSAKGFTEGFTEGYDELGLVTYDSSATVGYPTTPWNPEAMNYNGAGGPDTSFQSSSNPNNMVNQIAAIGAGGGTGMAEGLAVAYNEIQKAHERDLAANGVDTRMNVIVLFTDGVPSAVSLYLNPGNASGAYANSTTNPLNNVIAGGSGCTYMTDYDTHTAATNSAYSMFGAVVMGSNTGNPPYSQAWGLFQLATLDTNTAHTSPWYVADTGDSYGAGNDYMFPSPAVSTNPLPEAGCNGTPAAGSSGSNSNHWGGWYSLNNLSAIPYHDLYGTYLGPNMETGYAGYLYSNYLGASGGFTSIYNGTAFSVSNATTAYQWGLAAWDAVDNIASVIRRDANYTNRGDSSPMSIEIMTVGYTGDGGTDQGLLSKIANVTGCAFNGYSCFMDGQPTGMFVPASNGAELNDAMSTILSAILRLAH